MGCNTSKESAQPATEDDDKNDVKNGEIGKTTVSGESTAEAGSPVAGTPSSVKDREEEVNEEEAATRIQAAFRGHNARKSMKEGTTGKRTTTTTTSTTSTTSTPQQQQQQGGTEEDSEPTQEQLQQEFRADDKDLCNAATKIQASFRGHMSRKEQAVGSVGTAIGDSVENAAAAAAAKIEEKMDDALNELDGIDLTDPDLHKAATKIQASFRGHKVRQEVTPGTEEKK